ncbi:MAG: pyruvoyl-dependent arginine decarboxylase [Gammaproteobacteria bacterium]
MQYWHLTPGYACLTSGIGYGRTELAAFDAAELDANILAANAVKVTSFIPPYWHISRQSEVLRQHTGKGVFLPMAFAYQASDCSSIAAALAIGVNHDRRQPSIIMEYAGLGIVKEQALQETEIGVREAFKARHWAMERMETVVVEATPKDQLYACVLVAVVFIVDRSKAAF